MDVEENGVMEKRIVELDVECENLKDENTKLKIELEMEKKKKKEKCAKLKEAIVSQEIKWAEENEKIRKKCTKLDVEKRKLEIDLKRVASNELLVKFREAKEMVESMYKSIQEKDNEIRCLMGKVEDEANKVILEEQKSLDLGKRIHALEETVALEAKRQKHYTMSTNDEKKMDEVQAMISNLLKRIDACDIAKKAMQQKVSNLKKKKKEIKNEVVGLFGRIESLEEENKEMKEEVEQRKFDVQVYETVFDKEKRKLDAKFQEMKEEIERREEERKEMETKFIELKKEIEQQKIGVKLMAFKEEKREKYVVELVGRMEAKFMEMKAENEKQKMNVNVTAFEEENRKKEVMELVGSIESLKGEKSEMEAKLSRFEMAFKEKIKEMLMNLNDKDVAIKILMEENTTLENQKKELELEKARLRIKVERD